MNDNILYKYERNKKCTTFHAQIHTKSTNLHRKKKYSITRYVIALFPNMKWVWIHRIWSARYKDTWNPLIITLSTVPKSSEATLSYVLVQTYYALFNIIFFSLYFVTIIIKTHNVVALYLIPNSNTKRERYHFPFNQPHDPKTTTTYKYFNIIVKRFTQIIIMILSQT